MLKIMQLEEIGYGIAAVAAAALVLAGCASAPSDTPAASTTAAATSLPPSSDTAAPAHNGADMTFAQGMIPHHQQAIEMSDLLLGKADVDPAIVSLANEIKRAQAPEIEQMRAWVSDWAAATPAPGHDMPGHDMSGGMSEMPGMSSGDMGMMSAADMTALQNARGDEAGRLFLTQMIEHHEGAITMAQQEIDNGMFPAAIDMARSIVSSQEAEITTMREMSTR